MLLKRKVLILYIILIICLLLGACGDSPKEYALSKITLYNSNGSYEGEILVDEYGNNTQTTLLTEDGLGSITTISYIYDSCGNYVSRVYESETTSFEEKFTYKYDDEGNIIACEGMKDGEDMGNYEYVNGRLQKHIICDASGNIEDVREYFYDTAGNVIKETLSSPQINYVNTIEYSYDKYNHSTGYIVTAQREDDVITMEVVYENKYDSDGRLVGRYKYNIENGEKILVGSEVREYNE